MNEAHNCVIPNCSFSLMPSVPVLRGSKCQDSLCSLVLRAFLHPAARWSETVFVINAKAIAVQFISLTLFCRARYFYGVLLVGFCHFFTLAALLCGVCCICSELQQINSSGILELLPFWDSPQEVFFSVHLRDYPTKWASKRIWKINWSRWTGGQCLKRFFLSTVLFLLKWLCREI